MHDGSAQEVLATDQHRILGEPIQIKPAWDKQTSQRKVREEKDRKLFVVNLPLDVQPRDLFQHFEAFGRIEDIRVIKNKEDNVLRGFGFVLFKDKTSLQKVFAYGDKHIVKGQEVECRRVLLRDELLAQNSTRSNTQIMQLPSQSQIVKPVSVDHHLADDQPKYTGRQLNKMMSNLMKYISGGGTLPPNFTDFESLYEPLMNNAPLPAINEAIRYQSPYEDYSCYEDPELGWVDYEYSVESDLLRENIKQPLYQEQPKHDALLNWLDARCRNRRTLRPNAYGQAILSDKGQNSAQQQPSQKKFMNFDTSNMGIAGGNVNATYADRSAASSTVGRPQSVSSRVQPHSGHPTGHPPSMNRHENYLSNAPPEDMDHCYEYNDPSLESLSCYDNTHHLEATQHCQHEGHHSNIDYQGHDDDRGEYMQGAMLDYYPCDKYRHDYDGEQHWACVDYKPYLSYDNDSTCHDPRSCNTMNSKQYEYRPQRRFENGVVGHHSKQQAQPSSLDSVFNPNQPKRPNIQSSFPSEFTHFSKNPSDNNLQGNAYENIDSRQLNQDKGQHVHNRSHQVNNSSFNYMPNDEFTSFGNHNSSLGFDNMQASESLRQPRPKLVCKNQSLVKDSAQRHLILGLQESAGFPSTRAPQSHYPKEPQSLSFGPQTYLRQAEHPQGPSRR